MSLEKMFEHVKQDQTSWDRGYHDAMDGKDAKLPRGLDSLSYAAGYIEGKADRAHHALEKENDVRKHDNDRPGT